MTGEFSFEGHWRRKRGFMANRMPVHPTGSQIEDCSEHLQRLVSRRYHEHIVRFSIATTWARSWQWVTIQERRKTTYRHRGTFLSFPLEHRRPLLSRLQLLRFHVGLRKNRQHWSTLSRGFSCAGRQALNRNCFARYPEFRPQSDSLAVEWCGDKHAFD